MIASNKALIRSGAGSLSSVSIDMVGAVHLHRLHGLTEPAEDHMIYSTALPRILASLRAKNVHATFFVIASDAEHPIACEGMKSIVDAGHEIASLSYRHSWQMSEWSVRSIVDDMERAEAALHDALGLRPVGFRAPGQGMDIRVMRVLSERGYRYDSSIFPSPMFAAARGARLAWESLTGKLTNATLLEPGALLAPAQPYRPSRFSLHEPGDRKHSLPLWEIPIAVSRTLRMPLGGALLLSLPARIVRLLVNRALGEGRVLALRLQALDLLSADDVGVAPELVVRQPELRRSHEGKLKAFDALLDGLHKSSRIMAMREIADELDRIAGPPVIGPVD